MGGGEQERREGIRIQVFILSLIQEHQQIQPQETRKSTKEHLRPWILLLMDLCSAIMSTFSVPSPVMKELSCSMCDTCPTSERERGQGRARGGGEGERWGT